VIERESTFPRLETAEGGNIDVRALGDLLER
jgi:hypothetical protein